MLATFRLASAMACRTRAGAVPPGTSWMASTDCRLKAGIEILIKRWIQLAQFLQRQILQARSSLSRQHLHRFANLFVGQAKRHSALHQIGGGGPGVHKSGLGGLPACVRD